MSKTGIIKVLKQDFDKALKLQNKARPTLTCHLILCFSAPSVSIQLAVKHRAGSGWYSRAVF